MPLPESRSQTQIDEARSRHFGVCHVIAPGQSPGQRLGDVAGLPAGRPGQREGRIGGHVAMGRIARWLHHQGSQVEPTRELAGIRHMFKFFMNHN